MGTTARQNCWEFKSCGREPGGARVTELGVCPAAQYTPADGTHGGRNAGRICWAVAGTFCGGVVQGSFAQKRATCLACSFFATVKAEQGPGFALTRAQITGASRRSQLSQVARAARP